MSVYFIGAYDSDGNLTKVKIGESDRPYQRIKQLQTGSHERLELLKILPGNSQDEKQFHREFNHLRGSGEWFNPGSDLLAFIFDTILEASTIDQTSINAELSIEDADRITDGSDWLLNYVNSSEPTGGKSSSVDIFILLLLLSFSAVIIFQP